MKWRGTRRSARPRFFGNRAGSMHYRAVIAVSAALAAASATLAVATVSLRAGGPLDHAAPTTARVAPDPDVVRRATASVREGLEHAQAERPQAAANAYAEAT